MSAEPQPQVHYSQGKKDIGEAKNFHWEHPVPDNKFWAGIEYFVARNFLQSFTPAEAAVLPLDPDSDAPAPAKLRQLLQLLHAQAEARDAAAGPSQTLYDVDTSAWTTLWLAIYTVQDQLGDEDAADTTLRMLIERRKDKTNLSHLHTLTGRLLRQGRYAEAEATGLPVRDWLDGKLGKESPQAVGSRKMLAEAVWKQGPERRAEAEGMFAELLEIIEASGSGQYAVYQEENRETVEKLLAELRQADNGKKE